MSDKQKKHNRSSCCRAPVSVWNGNEGTNYWICDKCQKACDNLFVPDQSPVPEWEKEFDEKCEMSFAKGGFLTTDLAGTWEVDKQSLKNFITRVRNQSLEEAAEAADREDEKRSTTGLSVKMSFIIRSLKTK